MLPPRQFEQLNSHRCGDGVSSSSDWAMGQILKILTLPETATQLIAESTCHPCTSIAGGEFVRGTVANYWTNLLSSILHRVTTHLLIPALNLVISDDYIEMGHLEHSKSSLNFLIVASITRKLMRTSQLQFCWWNFWERL